MYANIPGGILAAPSRRAEAQAQAYNATLLLIVSCM